MTIDEKIAVLEAAKAKLEDDIVKRAEYVTLESWMNYTPGMVAQVYADRSAVGDLLYELYDRQEAELRGAGSSYKDAIMEVLKQ